MFNVKTEDTFYDGNHKIVNEVIQANPQSKPHRYQALKNYVNSLTCFKLTPLMLSLLPWSADHSSGLTGRAFSATMVCPSWQFSQWALSRPWFLVSLSSSTETHSEVLVPCRLPSLPSSAAQLTPAALCYAMRTRGTVPPPPHCPACFPARVLINLFRRLKKTSSSSWGCVWECKWMGWCHCCFWSESFWHYSFVISNTS